MSSSPNNDSKEGYRGLDRAAVTICTGIAGIAIGWFAHAVYDTVYQPPKQAQVHETNRELPEAYDRLFEKAYGRKRDPAKDPDALGRLISIDESVK